MKHAILGILFLACVCVTGSAVLGEAGQQVANTSGESGAFSGNDACVVWQENRSGNWDVYLFCNATQNTSRITLNPQDQINLVSNGDLLVWQDNHTV